MSKSDFERFGAEDVDARLTHEGLTHEGVSPPEAPSEKVNWRRVVAGTLVLIASVGGVSYWAGVRSDDLRERARQQALQQSRAALEPAVAAEVVDIPEMADDAVRRQPVTLVGAMPEESLPGSTMTKRTSVSFMEPIEGTTVSSMMLVQGMARNVPEAKHLWLVIKRDAVGGFWPKERIELAEDGKFEMQLWDFGEDGPFSICLVATDAIDTSRFNDWLLAGDRDGVWSPLPLERARSTTLGCQELKLDKQLNH